MRVYIGFGFAVTEPSSRHLRCHMSCESCCMQDSEGPTSVIDVFWYRKSSEVNGHAIQAADLPMKPRDKPAQSLIHGSKSAAGT